MASPVTLSKILPLKRIFFKALLCGVGRVASWGILPVLGIGAVVLPGLPQAETVKAVARQEVRKWSRILLCFMVVFADIFNKVIEVFNYYTPSLRP